MKALIRACGWELLYFGRWWLAGVTVLMVAGPRIFEATMRSLIPAEFRESGNDLSVINWNSPELVGYFVLLSALAFGIGPSILTAQSATARFSLPVTSKSMVTWYLIAGGGLVFVMTLLVTISYRAIYVVPWPMFVLPCWAGGIAALGISSVLWLRDSRWFRVVAVILIVACVSWWLERRFFDPENRWMSSEWSDVLFLCLTFALGWWMAFSEYQRCRCGDPMRGAILTFLIDPSDFERRLTRRQNSLSNAQQALGWLDQNRIRLLRLVITGLIFSGTLVGMSIALDGRNGLFTGLGLVVLYAAVVSAAVAGVMGQDLVEDRLPRMKHLVSTLPISNRQLADQMRRVIFRVATVSVLAGFVCLLLSVPISLVCMGRLDVRNLDWQHPLMAGFGPAGFWVPPALAVCLAWLMAGISFCSGLIVKQRPRVILAIFYGTLVLIIMIGVSQRTVFQPWAWGLLISLFALFSLWNLKALWQAMRLNLTHTTAAVIVTVIAFAVAAMILWRMPPGPVTAILAFVATLITVPFGALPLAIQASRHR